jgi:hypothetical protein
MAIPVMSHRLIVKSESILRGRQAESIIGELLNTIPVPVESTSR